MGYITIQWLKGEGVRQRNRSHEPIDVAIAGEITTNQWSKEHSIIAEISARRSSGDYQDLLLTQQEVDQVVTRLATLSTPENRLRIAASALSGLNDSELLGFLSDLLHRRGNIPRD